MFEPPNSIAMQLETDAPLKAMPGAWQAFEIARGAPNSQVLVVCDHATNLMPPEYGTLGLDSIQLNRHIGYDIGALAVARELGQRLNATVISSRYSRLLIDPNRGEDDPTLIMQLSDGAIVPGNAVLSVAERKRRIAAFHKPYHRAIEAELDAMLARGLVPLPSRSTVSPRLGAACRGSGRRQSFGIRTPGFPCRSCTNCARALASRSATTNPMPAICGATASTAMPRCAAFPTRSPRSAGRHP